MRLQENIKTYKHKYVYKSQKTAARKMCDRCMLWKYNITLTQVYSDAASARIRSF